MSDQSPASSPAPAPNPAIANATQVLAIKQLGETIAGVKKQVRTLWIAIAVLAVITVVVGVIAIGPRLGLGIGGRGTFQRGQFNGTIQNGAPGGAQGAPGTGVTQP
jgi:hypothetical protein